ncbi:MAG: dTDP-4-dehydrorhamnose 3,5-epimerase [Bacteroidales bacterium]|nr:dTDP-4-dehydrorhamnose 3,5-epimerase [Bacteroidales bacterium]
MNYIDCGLFQGPVIVEPKVFADARGYFMETFSLQNFCEGVQKAWKESVNFNIEFVQDNEAFSAQRGVIRGLHFQKGEYAQAKLVRVVAGAVLDVAVDIRPDSPTFGQHVAVELSAENHRIFYIPRGFAHGYAVLKENTIFQYKCDNYYAPASEGHYRWNDPYFNIKWPFSEAEAILSAKDAAAPLFEK